MRISAEGGEPESLGLAREGLQLQGLSAHPDGNSIAFTAGLPMHRHEIRRMENVLASLEAAR